MNVYGMLRVKNEARWIERVIRSIQPVTDAIFVLDDHSDDGTPALAEQLGAFVYRSAFEGIHEARDKDYLLGKVWEVAAPGDWCLMIDGDEALYQPDIPALVDAIHSLAVCCSCHIVYLWNREDQIRVDRWYREFRRPSLFKLMSRNFTFARTSYGGNLHCSSAPAALLSSITPVPVRLLHYGYLYPEDRVRKFLWYNFIDPNNEFEDSYRHMVVGDLYPADAAFKWAGPLELQPFA